MKYSVVAALSAMALAGSVMADEIYSTDFESDDGGWVASSDWDPVGDWEWGEYDFSLYIGGYNPPPAANSGTHLWGTVLHGDYTNAGGNSWLTQTFDFTGYTNVHMSFANWCEIFYSFDLAKLYVNNNVVYERTTDAAPTDWEMLDLDLSAYDDMDNVEIKFELYATTVVERAGWYVDDITITGDPLAPCLDLAVDNLVAGEQATFTVNGGTPGAKGVTVYGFKPGETVVNGIGGYCATFGISGVNQNRVIGGLNQTFDSNGTIQFDIGIPSGTSGRRVLFQSAERGTCPNECMSDAIVEVIG